MLAQVALYVVLCFSANDYCSMDRISWYQDWASCLSDGMKIAGKTDLTFCYNEETKQFVPVKGEKK